MPQGDITMSDNIGQLRLIRWANLAPVTPGHDPAWLVGCLTSLQQASVSQGLFVACWLVPERPCNRLVYLRGCLLLVGWLLNVPATG